MTEKDEKSGGGDDVAAAKQCECLVVDAAGFITNAPLNCMGDRVVTLREVVSEIRDKATKQRLQVLPYELEFKDPHAEDLKHVSDFAKKTGDYASLSATDLKVLALTFRLEKEAHNGSVGHLRTEPVASKPKVSYYTPGGGQNSSTSSSSAVVDSLPGFYMPKDGEDEYYEEGSSEEDGDNDSEEEKEEDDRIVQDMDDLKVHEEKEVADTHTNTGEDGVEVAEESDQEDEDETVEGGNDDDDDDGWITPSNLNKKKRQMNGDSGEDQIEKVKVACITNDFAMQNVLKQMGLNVMSSSGMLIRQTRTWIRRCYACFATTSDMVRKFCPKCGNATLKRVSCTVDADGRTQIHISGRRKLTGRGKRFPLPAPRGGKHAVNPLLCEDQPRPQQRVSKAARQRTDAMAEEYTSGATPFALRDVTSRSAMLGVSAGKDGAAAGAYWNRSNPNVVAKKTGNRRKKRVV